MFLLQTDSKNKKIHIILQFSMNGNGLYNIYLTFLL